MVLRHLSTALFYLVFTIFGCNDNKSSKGDNSGIPPSSGSSQNPDDTTNDNDPTTTPALASISVPVVYAEGLTILPLVFPNSGAAVASCSAQPELPQGLSIEVADGSCQISGMTMNLKGETTYTITAISENGVSVTATVKITVRIGIPPVLTDIPAPLDFVATAPVSGLVFPSTGDPAVACAVSPSLPAGLAVEVHAGGCRIVGAATASAPEIEYTVIATAIDGSIAEASFTMTVDVGNPPIIANANAQSYVATVAISPLSFVNTGAAAMSCEINPALPNGLVLEVDNDTCRISGQANAASTQKTYTVTAIAADESRDTATVSITVVAANPPHLSDVEEPLVLTRGEPMAETIVFANTGASVAAGGCSANPPLPSGLTLAVKNNTSPHTCQISGSPTVAQGETEHTITATAVDGSTKTTTITIKVEVPELDCPHSFIPVSEYTDEDTGTVPAFCVMKYEAKNDGQNNAVSQPGELPWTFIYHGQAVTACQAINIAGYSFDLISNAQWQSLARQIERYEVNGSYVNWENNSNSGSNSLNRGNSSSDGYDRLAANEDDANGCSGTSTPINCDNTWHLNKRTHTLPNGEVIWDLSGNVWEFVKDESSFNYNFDGLWYSATANSGSLCVSPGCSGPQGRPKAAFGPYGNYEDKSDAPYGGLGYGYTSVAGSGLTRGGAYGGSNGAGLFSANLGDGVGTSGPGIGFRCVGVPSP